MDLSPLVLRVGDSLSVRGVPVTDTRDLGLLLGDQHPDRLPGVRIEQPAIVRLEGMLPEFQAWPHTDARQVEITGKWTGRSVAVSHLIDEGAVAPLLPHDLGDGPPGDLTAVLVNLKNMRVLVGISMELEGPLRSAAVTATNVRMARDTLEPFFDELVVRRALHSSAELTAATHRMLSVVPDGLLSGFGDSTDSQGVRRSTASVQRVTPEIAAALEVIPETALDLTVSLRPSTPHDP